MRECLLFEDNQTLFSSELFARVTLLSLSWCDSSKVCMILSWPCEYYCEVKIYAEGKVAFSWRRSTRDIIRGSKYSFESKAIDVAHVKEHSRSSSDPPLFRKSNYTYICKSHETVFNDLKIKEFKYNVVWPIFLSRINKKTEKVN